MANRCEAASNCTRVACCQALSASACRATSRAGCEIGQGPSFSRRASRMPEAAKRNPTRAPASPKNLPSERRTISRGKSSLPASSVSEFSASASAKASSMISQPPRRCRVSAAASNSARGMARAVGLFGLHSRTIVVAAVSARCSDGRRRRAWPQRSQACGCSSYSGETQATVARSKSCGRVWIAACEPASGKRRGLP